MKTGRHSVYAYEEALEVANAVAADYRADGRDVCVIAAAGDCDAFPCPRELETWSGEICALYVRDTYTLEELYAIAYWD